MYASDTVETSLVLHVDDLLKLAKLPKRYVELSETIEVVKNSSGDVTRVVVRFKQYKHRNTGRIK